MKLFLVQAYEASEKGDLLLTQEESLFSDNVEHLRLELMEDLYRRKKRAYEFAGYIFVSVTPFFMMPVLKQWGLDFAPELEVFYAGTGKLIELITFFSSVVIYGFINKAKEITDDTYAGYEADVEKLTSKTIEAIDKVIADKEKDLLTV